MYAVAAHSVVLDEQLSTVIYNLSKSSFRCNGYRNVPIYDARPTQFYTNYKVIVSVPSSNQTEPT